jgi:hypothetical protein
LASVAVGFDCFSEGLPIHLQQGDNDVGSLLQALVIQSKTRLETCSVLDSYSVILFSFVANLFLINLQNVLGLQL